MLNVNVVTCACCPGKCDASNRQRPNVLQIYHAFKPVVDARLLVNGKLDPIETLLEVSPQLPLAFVVELDRNTINADVNYTMHI